MIHASLLSFPILILFSLMVETPLYSEFYDQHLSESQFDFGYLYGLFLGILASSLSTFAISFTTSWCMRVTTSTTYSMVGGLNKLPIAISGMIFFNDPITFSSVSSILMAFSAGLLYSYAKTKNQFTSDLPKYTPLTVNQK